MEVEAALGGRSLTDADDMVGVCRTGHRASCPNLGFAYLSEKRCCLWKKTGALFDSHSSPARGHAPISTFERFAQVYLPLLIASHSSVHRLETL